VYFIFTDLIYLLAKVIPYPTVSQGYTSFEKFLHTFAALRVVNFPKTLLAVGHGIEYRQQINQVRKRQWYRFFEFIYIYKMNFQN